MQLDKVKLGQYKIKKSVWFISLYYNKSHIGTRLPIP